MIQRILHFGRVTRHLPYVRGLGALRIVYELVLTDSSSQLSVSDFDHDLSLHGDVRENIGFNIWHRPETYEKYEREVFCNAITPGCTVLDVGANIGIYALLAAKRGARVFAIEADPRNVEVLRGHVHLNGFDDRVTVIHMAAADRAGTVTLFRSRRNSGHSNVFEGIDSVQVPSNTIDSLELPSIDVCKMDVEGAELMALSGMAETIAKSPNMKMLVEYARAFGQTDGLLEFIRGRFASVYAIRKRRSRRGPVATERELPSYCNLWAYNS